MVGFRCQSFCSSESFSLFWNTRALVAAAELSLVVHGLWITLSGILALVGKFVASLMLILRLIFSNKIASVQSLLVEALDFSLIR